MGVAQSREDLEFPDSDNEQDFNTQQVQEEDKFEDAKDTEEDSSAERRSKTPLTTLAEVEARLKDLKLKYPSYQMPRTKNAVKLYLHIGGNTPAARWVIAEKFISYLFIKTSKIDDGDDEESDDEDNDEG